MKKDITSSLQMMFSTKSMALVADTNTNTTSYFDSYLPDDCWICVFKFLDDDNNNRHYLKPLSFVSRKFLSITNRLLFSLTVYESSRPLLSCLFRRFPNLTSLDLSYCLYGDFNTLLCQISSFPLKLTSLKLSNLRVLPADGLRVFSQNITTLTSLTCSHMDCVNRNDLFLIVECFPLLEELDISYPLLQFPYKKSRGNLLFPIFKLSKLRKINISGHAKFNDQSLSELFKNCNLLEEVIMFNLFCITMDGIASSIRDRPTLRSLSFSSHNGSDIYATLFALVQNGPSLNEIRMKYTYAQDNVYKIDKILII